jgi:hypothetical protein
MKPWAFLNSDHIRQVFDSRFLWAVQSSTISFQATERV